MTVRTNAIHGSYGMNLRNGSIHSSSQSRMMSLTAPRTVIMNATAQYTPTPIVRLIVSATLSTYTKFSQRSGSDWRDVRHSGQIKARRAMQMHLVADTAPASAMRFEQQPALRTFYGDTSGNVGMSDAANEATAVAVRPRNNTALNTPYMDACTQSTLRMISRDRC